MDFDKVLEIRQATRKFKSQQISPEETQRILAAANHAPVGSSLYRDVHITVMQDQKKLLYLCEAAWKRFSTGEAVKKVAGDTVRGEDLAARHPNLFYGAPTVFFVSHRKQDLQPGIEFANVTTIATIMQLEATNLGLGSVFMWGALESMRMFPELDHTAVLELPAGFQPLIGVAVGYPENELGDDPHHHAPISVNFVK